MVFVKFSDFYFRPFALDRVGCPWQPINVFFVSLQLAVCRREFSGCQDLWLPWQRTWTICLLSITVDSVNISLWSSLSSSFYVSLHLFAANSLGFCFQWFRMSAFAFRSDRRPVSQLSSAQFDFEEESLLRPSPTRCKSNSCLDWVNLIKRNAYRL